MSNPLKKLAGQTVIYGLGTILPRLINYLLTPLLTYIFTPAEYGINSELYALISFLNVVFTYGMETTFFNFNSKLENKTTVYNTALVSVLLSTAVFTLLLVLFSGQIAEGLSTPGTVYLPQFIIWCVLIIASDALLAIPFAKLRAENKALEFSLMKLGNVVVNFGLTYFLLVMCRESFEQGETGFKASLYNPDIGIGYAFLANLIANLLSLLALSRMYFGLNFNIDFALLKDMLFYAWPLLILGLAGMVNETLDRIILKKLMPDKEEAQIAQGIYGACYKIAILMTIFIQAFRYAAEPFFFSKAKEKDSKQTYAIVMKYFVIFCLFLFLGTMLNLDWIQYFIGEEFRAGLHVVPILLGANLCLGIVYNLSIWYKLSGKTRFGAIISITGAAITILLNILFVPKFGYTASAWATLAAYAGMMLFSYFLGQKYFPIKYNFRALFVYTLIALGLYLLSSLFTGLESFYLRQLLNNLLILLFAFIIYKLELNTIKKLSST
ncbi:MAG: oligosaccharide flippase family protein [Bacteroidia bacterium]|nr:oligosaccharide flippase family protein [Bacteroidia bacterium]